MDTDKNKKAKLKQLVNILFVCIISIALLAGLLRTVFFPKDINYYENRYSNKIIAPNKSSVLDSSFQNSIEDALSDQIPGAQRLKKFYNQTMSAFSNFLVTPVFEKNTQTYINYKNGIKIFDDYFVYGTYKLEEIEDSFKAKANNYNKIFKEFPEIDFYTYYIEKDTDIDFENKNKINADEYLFSLLDPEHNQQRSFEIESFKDYSDCFYKTDHHWNHKGSYRAYQDIVSFLNCEGALVEKGKEVLISERYLGSKASTAGSDIITEPFYGYEFDFPEFKQIISGQDINYGTQEEKIASSPVGSISYGEFYGTDNGETVFDTGKTDLDNILIIGDSFDNAILKLIATHFNRTHSIDLRNYEHEKENKFNFKEYVETNEIDKVMFIGGIDFYSSSTFELEN